MLDHLCARSHPDRRRRPRPVEQRRGGASPQHRHVVDAVPTSEHRPDHRQGLRTAVRAVPGHALCLTRTSAARSAPAGSRATRGRLRRPRNRRRPQVLAGAAPARGRASSPRTARALAAAGRSRTDPGLSPERPRPLAEAPRHGRARAAAAAPTDDAPEPGQRRRTVGERQLQTAAVLPDRRTGRASRGRPPSGCRGSGLGSTARAHRSAASSVLPAEEQDRAAVAPSCRRL
jgi:hypothetical protein